MGRGRWTDGLSFDRLTLAVGICRAVARWIGGGGRHFLDPEICECVEQGAPAGVKIVKAKIHVTLKQGILDPQGKAIEHALDSLGFKNAGNVRVGKYMELEVDEADRSKAEKLVKAMCEKLLANTIVEEYRYELG